MCGIAGIWNLDGRPVEARTIDRLTDSLAHRGPDGRGVWFNDARNLAFGHRRLSILDLTQDGRQPMTDSSGRYCICFNGEIYNYLELREELSALGHAFKTRTDTEVLLAAYAQWGQASLPRLNGMWALAIYDRDRDEVFLARDRFGVKPLHYVMAGGRFAFASELKAFKSLEGFSPEIDLETARVYLRNPQDVEGTRRTMLKSVLRLQGGHSAIVRRSGLAITRWWNTLSHVGAPPARFEEQTEVFRDLLDKAIRVRLRSDVPLGMCLSGGFDSSALVCRLGRQMREGGTLQLDRPPRAFVGTFPGCANDERTQAEEVLKYAGIPSEFIVIREADALPCLDRVLHDYDDVGQGLAVAGWMIYQRLRQCSVPVSIDGHGLDELIGGYKQAGNRAGYWKSLAVDWLRFKLGFTRQPRRGLALLRDRLRRQDDPFVRAGEIDREAFLRVGDGDELPGRWKGTDAMLYEQFHSSILPTVLRSFDRIPMAHGIEVRSPFLDWRLVCFVMSLPSSSKINPQHNKWIAREAMKGSMPESIRVSGRKVGLNSPLSEWLPGPLRDWSMNLLSPPGGDDHPLLKLPELRSAFAAASGGGTMPWPTAMRFWRFLHLLWFERNFLQAAR